MEEPNQVQDVNIDTINDDDNLFEDSIVDEPVETEPVEEKKADEPVVESKADESTNEEVAEAPFLEIQYNKEIKGLSRDEAKTLAQKGMNYDHIVDKFNNLNGPLEMLAKRSNMSVSEYVNKLGEAQMEENVLNEIDTLREMYPNSDENALRELAESRVKDKFNFQNKQMEDEQAERANAQQEAIRQDIRFLEEQFPDIDINNLPQEVFDNVDRGMSLPLAYFVYAKGVADKNKSVEEAKVKVAKLNEANQTKSMGDTTNVGDVKQDDFLEGLNSI